MVPYSSELHTITLTKHNNIFKKSTQQPPVLIWSVEHTKGWWNRKRRNRRCKMQEIPRLKLFLIGGPFDGDSKSTSSQGNVSSISLSTSYIIVLRQKRIILMAKLWSDSAFCPTCVLCDVYVNLINSSVSLWSWYLSVKTSKSHIYVLARFIIYLD